MPSASDVPITMVQCGPPGIRYPDEVGEKIDQPLAATRVSASPLGARMTLEQRPPGTSSGSLRPAIFLPSPLHGGACGTIGAGAFQFAGKFACDPPLPAGKWRLAWKWHRVEFFFSATTGAL